LALSGSFYKTIASGYRLLVEWSAKQDYSANESTITAKLYWVSTSSAYYISSSSSRKAYLVINGNTTEFDITAQLSGNQKKLLGTKVYTTGHDPDGTKTSGITGTINLSGIRLSGTDYGSESTSDTFDLNPIPRKSTVTSSMSWRSPNAFPVSISRASSSFKHDIKFYVKRKSTSTWTLIKTWQDIETYSGGGFTVTEMKNVYTTLAQDSSGNIRVVLETFDGSKSMGTNTYDGEVVVEYSSKISSSPSWNIGDPVHVDIARNHHTYTHILKYYVGTKLIHTSPTVEFSDDWTPTPAEITDMYNQVKTSKTGVSKIEVYTYYEGIQVDVVKVSTGTATVTNSEPIFGTGYTYKDTNAATVAITANDQQIIQSKSTVRVELPTTANATAQNGATISSYTVTLNGVSKTLPYSSSSTLVFDMGVVNAATNVTLKVEAVDSRGFKNATTKTVTILPYSTPSLSANIRRKNGFEADTLIDLKSTISSLSGKNDVVLSSGAQYRYKENVSSASFPTAWTNLTLTKNSLTFTATQQTVTLDQAKAYIFEIRVTDKLGNTVQTKTVAVGKPDFMIDVYKHSVGVGKMPDKNNSFELENDLYTMKNLRVQNPTNGTAEAYFGWYNNIARIRVGGTSTGAVNGLEIQGTGDTPMLKLRNGQRLEVVDSSTVTLNGIDLMRGLAVPRSTPSMQNGFTTYFGTAYLKTYEGIVMLMGMVQGSMPADGADVVIFNLPEGCRPVSVNQIFYCHVRGGDKAMRVDVNTNGDVVVKGSASESGGYANWIDLNGVIFHAS
jgi:hypothetical protein